MTQAGFFDLEEGRARRDAGHERFRTMAFIEKARRAAHQHCLKHGYVTTDDLHALFPEVPSGNYWGAVLKPPYFVKVGEVQSKRPAAHARWIHKWVIGPAWRKYA